MTDSNTPRSMFIAENGNVTHLGWIAHLYSCVEAYDEASGRVDYVLRVDFVEERARRPILIGTATTERLAELTIDFFTVIELYRRRLTSGYPVPNLHAVDVRDDKAKVLRALGLDEQSPEVRELMEEMAPKLVQAEEEVRELAVQLKASSASLGDLITESGERVAIKDIDLDCLRPFDYYRGPDNRPEAHTYVVDFYRRGGGPFRVIHGRGGEAEAVEYGLSLLHLLLAFRERGIEMDLLAVDVRDRLEEVEEAAGLTRYER